MVFKIRIEQGEKTNEHYLVFSPSSSPSSSSKLPYNIDFETFRKTNKVEKDNWENVIKFYYNLDVNGGEDQERGDCDRDMKERFVPFRWPRDPNGPTLKEEESGKGKETPNGCELWGATLYDFYRVARIPSQPNLVTISTGSKLYDWCHQKSELSQAKDQLLRAEMEESPHQIHVFDIGKYLEMLEELVWKGKVGKSYRGVVDASQGEQAQMLYPLSTYPAPWPLRPFSAPLARLQSKFKHDDLPRKLIVHDPWNVLLIKTNGELEYEYDDEDEDDSEGKRKRFKWGEKEDIIRVYRLHLDSSNSNTDANAESEAEAKEYRCPVAHLYVSPKRLIGRGNHSFVYQVELELPRDMLVQPKVCWECSMGNYYRYRESKQDSEMEKSPSDEQETSRASMSTEEKDEVDEGEVKEYFRDVCRFGKPFIEDTLIKDHKYAFLNDFISWQTPSTASSYCSHLSNTLSAQSETPIPTPPSHRVSVTAKLSYPPSPDSRDDHADQLLREARFYQKFPSHLSEHWNGYNVIPPVHDPTPVGAVVPQFYGYYVPDEEIKEHEEGEGEKGNKEHEEGEGEKTNKEHGEGEGEEENKEREEGQGEEGDETKEEGSVFISPILLLEHCGVQVRPAGMSIDDRQECLSLLRRLHISGYTHGSIYQRNFLVQYGPLQFSPFRRSKAHRRFRLIDFGRAEDYTGRTGSIVDDKETFLEMSLEVRDANESLRLGLF